MKTLRIFFCRYKINSMSSSSSTTICSQCSAITSKGGRCKNNTCATYPYCWIHLKSIDKLRVKQSTIARAGKGLFYVGKKTFPVNKKIVDYSSKGVSKTPNKNSKYVLKVGERRYMDSKDTDNFVGRYINASRGTGRPPNVRFTKGRKIYDKNDRKVVPIYTKQKIKPNTELLLNYGRNYFDNK